MSYPDTLGIATMYPIGEVQSIVPAQMTTPILSPMMDTMAIAVLEVGLRTRTAQTGEKATTDLTLLQDQA